MQQGKHRLGCLLDFLLAGFIIVFMTVVFFFFLLTTLGGFFILLINLVVVAIATPAALPTSTILASLLVTPFIFSFLVLDQLFVLLAILEIMALGPMDLVV